MIYASTSSANTSTTHEEYIVYMRRIIKALQPMLLIILNAKGGTLASMLEVKYLCTVSQHTSSSNSAVGPSVYSAITILL